MDEKQFKQILLIGAGAFVLWLFMNRKQPDVVSVAGDNAAFYENVNSEPSTDGWIPGTNSPNIVWGGDNPYMNVNLEIPTDFLLGSLARQYIPLFGYSGVTAVGSM